MFQIFQPKPLRFPILDSPLTARLIYFSLVQREMEQYNKDLLVLGTFVSKHGPCVRLAHGIAGLIVVQTNYTVQHQDSIDHNAEQLATWKRYFNADSHVCLNLKTSRYRHVHLQYADVAEIIRLSTPLRGL